MTLICIVQIFFSSRQCQSHKKCQLHPWWCGYHWWRQTNWLSTVIDSFAVYVWSSSILCSVDQNHPWLAFKSSNVISIVISCVFCAVSRLAINNVTEKLFFEHSWEWEDTVRIGVEPRIATFTFVLSILSISHK